MISDMIVNLNELEIYATSDIPNAFSIRRAVPWEKHEVLNFGARHFIDKWVSEIDISFSRQPVGCFIAVEGEAIAGFCVCDVSARGFIGPIGVRQDCRGRGIGKALLHRGLHALRDMGYRYGIIGRVGPQGFFSKAAGAVVIPQSRQDGCG